MWNVPACCKALRASNFIAKKLKSNSRNVKKSAVDHAPFPILRPPAVSPMHFAPARSSFSPYEMPTKHKGDVMLRLVALCFLKQGDVSEPFLC